MIIIQLHIHMYMDYAQATMTYEYDICTRPI